MCPLTRLLTRLLIYIVPFVILLAVPGIVLILGGEFTSAERAIELQSMARETVLFGRAYSDPTARYKLLSVLKRRPEVIVLGTSRVLALRGWFFRNNVSFFNAGNGVTRLRHFRAFVTKIPIGSEPRVLVVGLDQYLFNERFDSLGLDDMEAVWEGGDRFDSIFLSSWLKVYYDYWERKFSVHDFIKPMSEYRIGLNAVVNGNGFRNDGSYTWAQHIENRLTAADADRNFDNTLSRIAKGHRRFEYGEQVSARALAELRAFLEECRSRGIHVVAFLPPFANAVFRKMWSMHTEYGYLRELRPRLMPAFVATGFALHDFSDLASVGASDKETIDGFHASEKAYLRLFLRMCDGDVILKDYAQDTALLKIGLESSENDYTVFPSMER